MNCKLNGVFDAFGRIPRAKPDLERVQTRRFRGRNSSDFLDKNEREKPADVNQFFFFFGITYMNTVKTQQVPRLSRTEDKREGN